MLIIRLRFADLEIICLRSSEIVRKYWVHLIYSKPGCRLYRSTVVIENDFMSIKSRKLNFNIMDLWKYTSTNRSLERTLSSMYELPNCKWFLSQNHRSHMCNWQINHKKYILYKSFNKKRSVHTLIYAQSMFYILKEKKICKYAIRCSSVVSSPHRRATLLRANHNRSPRAAVTLLHFTPAS